MSWPPVKPPWHGRPAMEHGQDARATPKQGFCKSLELRGRCEAVMSIRLLRVHTKRNGSRITCVERQVVLVTGTSQHRCLNRCCSSAGSPRLVRSSTPESTAKGAAELRNGVD